MDSATEYPWDTCNFGIYQTCPTYHHEPTHRSFDYCSPSHPGTCSHLGTSLVVSHEIVNNEHWFAFSTWTCTHCTVFAHTRDNNMLCTFETSHIVPRTLCTVDYVTATSHKFRTQIFSVNRCLAMKTHKGDGYCNCNLSPTMSPKILEIAQFAGMPNKSQVVVTSTVLSCVHTYPIFVIWLYSICRTIFI